MSCCGGREEKLVDLSAEQKWDYINLSDFKSHSCLTPFSYGVLYISLIISVAAYGVDIFTAVNLLVFDRWSGEVKPVIPFDISKWIFAACIILSWVFLIYRWLRALSAMRSDGVARSYLDPLAVRIQSIRMGSKGRGWRRFLVFAELTKSKKGSEYLALFTYFSFEAWMRIVFAEGPRNVINALTLYSVMQLNLIPIGKHAASDGRNPAVQFFYNIKVLAAANGQQAAILLGMLFTLLIWVISALSLIAAIITYITFLWHHIPSTDGSLKKFCKRKIDTRLQKIVSVKNHKALTRNVAPTVKGRDQPVPIRRQPTIPLVGDEKVAEMPTLSRQTTQTTLPPYTSRPSTSQGIGRQPTLPNLDNSRPIMPARSATQSSAFSNASYASDAPLMGGAGLMGHSPSLHSEPSIPSLPPLRTDSNPNTYNERPRMNRSATDVSQQSQASNWAPSLIEDDRRTPSLCRQPTDRSNFSQSSRDPGFRPPIRQYTGPLDYLPHGRSTPGPFPLSQSRQPPPRQITPVQTFNTRPPPQTITPNPAQEFEMRPQTRPPPRNNPYIPYNPPQSSSAVGVSEPLSNQPVAAPYRNFTSPMRPAGDRPYPPQRSGTAPLPQTIPYDSSIYDSYGGRDGQIGESRPAQPPMPVRAATAIGNTGAAGRWNGPTAPPPRTGSSNEPRYYNSTGNGNGYSNGRPGDY
ncbi:MAG: hypothetical protein MMC33_001011 [Icmadophila ericetorum]|nr:hypothetical protein [Icmadophila ericetorum]